MTNASTLLEALGLEPTDANLGTVESWDSTSEPRSLCYALRIDDGRNAGTIAAWLEASSLSDAAVAPAGVSDATASPSGDPVASSSGAEATPSSSESVPVDPATPAPVDPATPTA